MDFYHIDEVYIAYLRAADSRVPENKGGKRPYIGIVLAVEGIDYFVPMTSPKPKHLKMKNGKDFRKIDQGRLGAINFNNMIPAPKHVVQKIDISSEPDPKYKRLLQNQYIAIRSDQQNIEKTARLLRQLILSEDKELTTHDRAIKQRCCDLRLLESISQQYPVKN